MSDNPQFLSPLEGERIGEGVEIQAYTLTPTLSLEGEGVKGEAPNQVDSL